MTGILWSTGSAFATAVSLVVPNSVPRPFAVIQAAAEAPSPVQILFLGDPSRRKGVHDLLAALSQLKVGPSAARRLGER